MERKTIELNQYGQYKVTLSKEAFASVKKELAKIENDYDGENPEGTTFVFYEKAIRQLEKAMNGEEVFEYWMNVAKAIGLETKAFTGITLKEKAQAVLDAGYEYKVVNEGMTLYHTYSLNGQEVVRTTQQSPAIHEAYAIMTTNTATETVETANNPAIETLVVEAVVTPKTQRDGLDALRKSLSPLVQMSIEYPFSDQVMIKLSIPNPVSLQPSIHTRYFMETEYVKRAWYADTGWTSYPEERKRITIEAWKEKMSDWANRMLKEAQTDPVKFFEAR